ncbi:MAG: (Fe-S)-binding protein [Anaerolineae bacterium]|nr:(Fe-S)-binding protein [Anaerolineae bacterium]
MPQLDLSHFSFRQLMELDACTRCGECVKWCPTFIEAERDEITPLDKIHTFRGFARGQYGHLLARLFGYRPPTEESVARWSKGTYDCTLCGRCAVVCPVHIETRPLWIAMREQLVEMGAYPQVMDALRENVAANYNISGDPAEDRLIWSQNLEVVPEGVRGKEQAEVVYFVGCTASFYPMTYVIPQAFVHILEKAEVDFATMGAVEWCCGFPLIIAGMNEATRELVTHNVAAVRELGVKTLVAACPSCFHTWEHTYPEVLGEPLGFEVKHTTQYLEELITNGRIKLGSFDRPVTYHDPCDLGRTGGIYDAPRNVIRAIPGIEFREMAEIREYALCCGGGGDVEMADRDLVAAVSKRRLEQAQATEAQVILSACQQCKRTLTASTRQEKVRMRVLDLVELVDQVLEE